MEKVRVEGFELAVNKIVCVDVKHQTRVSSKKNNKYIEYSQQIGSKVFLPFDHWLVPRGWLAVPGGLVPALCCRGTILHGF